MAWQLNFLDGARSMADNYYRAYSVKRVHRPLPPPTPVHLRASFLLQFQERNAQENGHVKEEPVHDQLGLTAVELDEALASNDLTNTRDLMATLVETVSPIFVSWAFCLIRIIFVFVMMKPFIYSLESFTLIVVSLLW